MCHSVIASCGLVTSGAQTLNHLAKAPQHFWVDSILQNQNFMLLILFCFTVFYYILFKLSLFFLISSQRIFIYLFY